jgi:serine/threonine-protein kinase
MSNDSPRSQVVNDRYRIERRIGRGGMADVFLARDVLLDRQVAIKVLFPEHATDPNFVERFRREAQSVAQLNHPNIVSVYDWGQTGNTYFMAMEYVDGITLAEHLKRNNGKLTPKGAARIAAEVAAALAFAHRSGVVHRDIKPGNILIARNTAIKVVDFGIARAMDAGHDAALTQDGAVMGTATYFSPEQAKGEALDPRSDLYSLGVVLYEMVAGRPPFVGETALATAYKQVNEMPAPLRQFAPDVPRTYEAIVAKCLTKVVEKRYDTADQLRDDLRRYLADQPVLALEQARADAQGRTVAPADAPTTMLPPVTGETVTVDNEGTTVMPASARPTPSTVDTDDEPRNRTKYIAGAVAAGAVLLAGIIFVVMSVVGSSGLKVPDVMNLTYEQARTLLTERGFQVVPEPLAKDGVGDDIVWQQNPVADSEAAEGSAITVTYNPAKPPVVVPPIQGLTLSQATAELQKVGLTLEIVEQRIDSTLGAGQIISQDPAGQQEVPAGTAVKVVVSAGAGQVIVPNVTGQEEAAATQLLKGAPFNFTVTRTEEASPTVAKGRVVRTDPAVDLPVDSGSSITLVISSGPVPVDMPNVKGLSEADAKKALDDLGLKYAIEYVDVAAGNVNIGKVIAQGTAAATKVTPGTVIDLTIGRYVETTTVAPSIP